MHGKDRIGRPSRWLTVLCGLVFACAAQAQELSVLGGVLRPDVPDESIYTWGFTYLQALDEHNALSYSWINERYIQDNHRDGLAVQ
jgi:hypothetical protein